MHVAYDSHNNGFLILDVPKILGQIQDRVSQTKTRKNFHTKGCRKEFLWFSPNSFDPGPLGFIGVDA
jgi:hypothetical protein